jgi:cysteine protease ATG4
MGEGAAAPAPPRLPTPAAAILRAFADSAAAPLSIHAIIAAGGPASPGPGEWWGPWAFCHAAAAALEAGAAALGPGVPRLRTLLVAGPGGGAPSIGVGDADWGGEAAAAAAEEEAAADPAAKLPPLAGGGGEEEEEGDGDDDTPAPPPPPPPPTTSPPRPLLVLIPLVLGAGRSLNPLYTASLAAALAWPQSVGLLGGRRGAALWVVGSQGGGAALVVDPHTPQAAVADPAAEEAGGGGGGGEEAEAEEEEGGGVVVVGTGEAGAAANPPAPAAPVPAAAPAATPADTYFGAPLRTTPLAGLDPSLALGFLCRDASEWGDLVARLGALEAGAGGAPLVCVRAGGVGKGAELVAAADVDRRGEGEDEEWVLV